jgi:hypothetical protein
MKELKDVYKNDNELMKMLKVGEIRHVLAHTDKGDLCLMIRKGQLMGDYRFVLDAVPVSEEVNKYLIKQLDGMYYKL